MQNQSNPLWPQFLLQSCKQKIADLAVLWKEYLASLRETGLADRTSYKNTQGERFTTKKAGPFARLNVSPILVKSLIASGPAGVLLAGAIVLFRHAKITSTALQLVGAGCWAIVVLAHIAESFRLFPGMGWARNPA
jgi:hypothetical protein